MTDLRNIDIEIENLRRLNKQAYASRADQYQAEANKSEAGLRSLFFTMAMGVITLSSPIFFGRTLDMPLMSDVVKTIVTISLLMLFLSILFGLLDFVITIKFFEKWANNKSEGERIWSQYALPNYENFEKMGEEAKQVLLASEHTPILALCLQATFVILGFSLLLAAGLLTLWQ
jgi:ABC-type protease/lipase transport system fused ATPase/permease subunit